MKLKKYSLEQLKIAISKSFSLRSVLVKLNVQPYGGNYEILKKSIEEFKIDTSHLTGRGHLRGKTNYSRLRSLSSVLVNKKYENTWRLKNRLIKEGFKERKCEECNLINWLGKPVPLELHHKDGNRKNNCIDNLALLCPNCHALTDNYRGKNNKCVETRRERLTVDIYGQGIVQTTNLEGSENYSGKKISCPSGRGGSNPPLSIIKIKKCLDCNKVIDRKAKRCKRCAGMGRSQKINWPPIDDLKIMVKNSSYLAVGKKLGVSDNAIRKHIKNYENFKSYIC